MRHSGLKWLKIAALLEGTSLVALVFVAVPLKYWVQLPMAVKLIGPVHGALFVGFILTLLSFWAMGRVSLKLTLIGAVASFIPFGSFVYKAKLLK
ncbi:MAG: hypothetical protein CSA68_05740 [Rhodobacterales bacterium]|nr:MAG: hypothetical protein CSA68_05740 [Rhodobacterales bacterium]